MPKLIKQPTLIKAVGNKSKQIAEFIGRVNSGHAQVSVARMKSPEGWKEPGQTPEFEEISIVLSGVLCVEYKDGKREVHAGETIVTQPGEWVRYSTPEGPNILRSACRRFHQTRFIAMAQLEMLNSNGGVASFRWLMCRQIFELPHKAQKNFSTAHMVQLEPSARPTGWLSLELMRARSSPPEGRQRFFEWHIQHSTLSPKF